jgi:hypothetical protein
MRPLLEANPTFDVWADDITPCASFWFLGILFNLREALIYFLLNFRGVEG